MNRSEHVTGQHQNVENATQENVKDSRFILKWLDRIIGASLFMLVFGLPLFFTGVTFQGIVFEKQLYFYFWLLLALISWSAKGVITEEMNIRRTPLDIPILGFWLAYLLATIFSIDRWHSFWGAFGDPSRGFMSITAIIITYYLMVSNFNSKRLKMLFTALVSSGTLLTIWTLVLFFTVPFTNYSLTSLIPDRLAKFIPLSIIGSVSGLGAFFSVMIIIITVAILKLAENEVISKGRRKTLTGLFLLVLVADLFLVLSISGYVPWAGLFIGAVLFLVYILSKIVRPHREWIWLPMVIFVLIMVVRMTGNVSFVKVNLPIEVSADSKISWEIAKDSLKNKFFLGSGPATYGYDFSLFRPKSFNDTQFYNFRFSQATGMFFEAISTIGGLGVFFLVILALSFLSVSLYLISREKEKNKLYSLGLFSAAVIALTDAALTKTEGSVLIFALLLGMLALATILLESEATPKYLALSLKASPKFALALAFIFMVISAGVAFLFVFLGKVYVADVYAGSAAREIGQNQEDAIARMDKAVNLYGQENVYYTKAGAYYMILANNEALKPTDQRDLDKIKQYLNFAVSVTAKGVDMNKESIEATEALAQIYENSGMYVADSLKLTSDTYKRALELEPYNPDFYLKLGQVSIADASTQKDEAQRKAMFAEAKDYFQKAIDLKADFAPGYYQLSLIQDALGDTDKAIESATNAAKLDGLKNADYLISLANMYRLRAKNDDLKAAEDIFKMVTSQNDKNVNAHFYLGMAYEKDKNKDAAKTEYQKVISLLSDQNSGDAKKQLEKMISNIDRGIENTPENLGLTTPKTQDTTSNTSQDGTTTTTGQ